MKYETIVEDWHGHITSNTFEASSQEEAIKIARNEYGYMREANDDVLRRIG